MNEILVRLLDYPPIGKFVIGMLKGRAIKPYEISLEKTIEKQENLLKKKLKAISVAEIGKKLGARKGASLSELPITTYEFYEPFFANPSQNALMYPTEAYERIKTSGTAGTGKWFMIPRKYIEKSFMETGLSTLALMTYDGEKMTLEFGDTIYLNTAPRPYAVGVGTSVMSGRSGKFPMFNLIPPFNLPFEEKVEYFLNHCESIDVATMQASILVSRIIPAMNKTLKLKAIFCPDTAIAETYFDEISEFAGTPPKTSYNSTETLSCSVPSQQYPLGFFLDWRRGIFEFLPLIDGKTDSEKARQIDQVRVGEVYRVLYTGFETDLTRYDTNNAFKCVAKGDDLLGIDHPIFKFHSRLEKTISICNFTRISEDELIDVLTRAGISFVEFTARMEIEKGLERMALYLETTEHRNSDEVESLLHRQLYEIDSDYRDLTDYYSYVPIKVNLLPRGTFARYLGGKVAAMSKIDRIEMREDEFQKLTE